MNVDKQNQVQLAVRQLRIGFDAQNSHYVCDMLGGGMSLKQLKHARLDIIRVDNPAGGHDLRNSNAVKSSAGSYIADKHARFKIELSDGFFRLFFLFTLSRSSQPAPPTPITGAILRPVTG